MSGADGSWSNQIVSQVIIVGTGGQVLVYSGAIALGDLVASLSGAAGTDGVGNAYVEGVAAYATPVSDRIAVQLGLGSFLGTPAAGLFTHDQTSPATSDPFVGSLGNGSAVMSTGQSTGGATAAGIECLDSVQSGVVSGEVDVVAGLTFVQGNLQVSGNSTLNGSNGGLVLSPLLPRGPNFPTSGTTLAQTQAFLDFFYDTLRNLGMAT